MKNENITLGFGYRFTQFIQGLLIGFLSMIPFMDTQRIRELFRDDDDQDPFAVRMKRYFNQNATRMLGTVIGMLCFFYIPLTSLTLVLGKPIYLSLMALAAGFLIADFYLAFRKNEREFLSPSKILKMAVFFLIGLAIPFLIRFVPFQEAFELSLTSNDSILLISFLMILAGFLGEYFHCSVGTLLAISSTFLSLNSSLFSVLRFSDIKSHLVFLLVFCLSYAVSSVLGYAFRAKGKNEKERSMANIGLMAASLYFFYIDTYNNASFEMAFENEAVTKDMKLVVTLTLLALGFIISLALSGHCYRFINRRETKEDLKEHPNYLKDTLTHDLEVEDRSNA